MEKFTMVFNFVPGTRRANNCTFCGCSGMVSNYVAGVYVVQLCERCAENPPGVVKETEERLETKKKKK